RTGRTASRPGPTHPQPPSHKVAPPYKTPLPLPTAPSRRSPHASEPTRIRNGPRLPLRSLPPPYPLRTGASERPTAPCSPLPPDGVPHHHHRLSAGIRPVPRIHHAPVLRVAQDDSSAYALAIMRVRTAPPWFGSIFVGWWVGEGRPDFDPHLSLQNPDPIGMGLAMEAVAEAAGPECIVPGQQAPLRLMGLKVQIHLSLAVSDRYAYVDDLAVSHYLIVAIVLLI
uniref:Uncharacterized protein n=1 Tax=Aegilops tauschii subsp. strangulata TaxID=200361 RepID=A0A453FNE3_AEGTS